MSIEYSDYQKYKQLGISVVGIPSIKIVGGEKRVIFPKSGWKKYQSEYATRDEINGWVEEGRGALAVVTGKLSKLVVIDVDEENQDKYSFLQTPMRVRSVRSRGVHYYFRYTEALASFGPQTKVLDLKMDYRGEGGLVFAPPTMVGDENGYEFIGEMDLSNFNLESLPELPDEVFINLSDSREETQIGEYLERDKGNLILPELFEGNRNQESTRVIGSIIAKSNPEIWEGVIWPAVRIWNQEKVSPPQDERALRSTFEQVVKSELRKRDEEIVFNVSEPSSFLDMLQEQIKHDSEGKFFTGYENVDKSTGGFSYHNTYVVSGIAKSGKSTWLMNMLANKLSEGVKIGFINTELPILEFCERMTAYHLDKEYGEVTTEEIVSWAEEYSDKFYYLGVEQLSTKEQLFEDIAGFIGDIECLVFDNVTSWGSKLVEGVDPWQLQADVMDSLVKITSKNKVVTFMVLHTKPGVIVSSTVKPSQKMLDDPFSVFDKSISFVRKPSISDVYGGGTALSQVSGAIIIWRPFQHYHDPNLNRITKVVLSSMRRSDDEDIPATFIGSRGKFLDKETQQLSKNIDDKE